MQCTIFAVECNRRLIHKTKQSRAGRAVKRTEALATPKTICAAINGNRIRCERIDWSAANSHGVLQDLRQDLRHGTVRPFDDVGHIHLDSVAVVNQMIGGLRAARLNNQ